MCYLTCSYYFILLFSCQRKRKAKLKSDGQVNGVDPLGEDDDDRVKEIARHFEEKYVSIVFVWNEILTRPLMPYIPCV